MSDHETISVSISKKLIEDEHPDTVRTMIRIEAERLTEQLLLRYSRG